MNAQSRLVPGENTAEVTETRIRVNDRSHRENRVAGSKKEVVADVPLLESLASAGWTSFQSVSKSFLWLCLWTNTRPWPCMSAIDLRCSSLMAGAPPLSLALLKLSHPGLRDHPCQCGGLGEDCISNKRL